MSTAVPAGQPASDTFDGQMDADWRAFRRTLADALVALPPGGRAVLRPAPDMVWGGEFLWAHVKHDADHLMVTVPSNAFLPRVLRLSPDAMRTLRGTGLKRRHSGANYRVALPMSHVDQAASILCTALRDCLGVLHPTCLEIAGPNSDVDSPQILETSPLPLVVAPDDRDHLEALLAEAITRVPAGVTVASSEDGYVLWSARSLAAVSINPNALVVMLRASVIRHLEEPGAARMQVNELNKKRRGVTFYLQEDAVFAEMHLIALPFVASHVLAAIDQIMEVSAEAAELLRARVGGESFASSWADEQDGPAF